MKPPTIRAALRRIRTVLVDDSPAVVAGIGRFLATQPGVAVVGVALNASDAIERVAENQPDLVVMDVYMPEMSGLEAAAILRRRFPELRIILISIDQGAQLQRECLRHGADRYLSKIGLHRTLLPELRQLFPDGVFPEKRVRAAISEGAKT